MLERVRQAFLNEPVRGQVDARREARGFPLHLQIDGETGLSDLVDELAQVLQARLGSERRLLLGPSQHPDEPSHLGERLAACLLDHEQRFALALLLGSQQAPHARGLHGHHADAVADHVVQLARDACPLLSDGGPRPLLTLPLEPLGALLDLPVLGQLRAESVPGEPDDREQDRDEQEVAGTLTRIVVSDDRARPDPDRQSGHRLSPVGEHAEQE